VKSSQCPATPNGLACEGTSTALDRSTNERPGALPNKRSRARDELLALARAREYWDRAIKYLKLARLASNADVQRRFMAIAQHYRALAQAEERNAERMNVERRSRNTGPRLLFFRAQEVNCAHEARRVAANIARLPKRLRARYAL